MLDEAPEDDEATRALVDPEVRWLWAVAVVAEAFHLSPRQAAAELEEDAEGITVSCLGLLRYSDAKRAYESAARGGAKAMTELRQSSPRAVDQVEETLEALMEEDDATGVCA